VRTDFDTDHDGEPALRHGGGCNCLLHARRRLGGALFGAAALAGAWPASALAQPDPECKRSFAGELAPAEQLEQAASQQYRMMLQQAGDKRALGPSEHPQVRRLRYIAQRIIPYAEACNERSRSWKWDVNLIGSNEINAFCMPGGKIAFYYGILSKLQLTDDEVAIVMGHEISHALLEHAREQLGKRLLTRGAIELGSALLGLGGVGRMAADYGGALLSLKFGRTDESEADALGLVLSARAGYDPRAGVTLWRKMAAASKGAPPQWLSTHPSGATRIQEIEMRLPRAQPLYARADKPDQRFAPPQPRAY
jgi:predicted Zn-dependent protease